jgi:hypothetical protein
MHGMIADTMIVDLATGAVIAEAGQALDDEMLYRMEMSALAPLSDCKFYGRLAPVDFRCNSCEVAQSCMDAWATGSRLVSDGALRPLHNQAQWAEMLEPDPEALEFRRMIRAGMDERDSAAVLDAECLTEADWLALYA